MINNFNKHIHQIWFQPLGSTSPEGTIGKEDYVNCQKTYKDFASKNYWRYTLWTESTVDDFVKEYFPNYYQKYTEIDSIIKKVDCARYMILFIYGGLYVDMDSYLRVDLDKFLQGEYLHREPYSSTPWHLDNKLKLKKSYTLGVGQEKVPFEYFYNKFGILIPKINNAVIFASPNNNLFLELIEEGFQRVNNSIANSFGVHTFSLKVYEEMVKTIKALLRQNNPKLPSSIITFPPIYFYEADASRDDYEYWGGNPKYKDSPLQTIVHKFDQNWDGLGYRDFLLEELDDETLDRDDG